MLLGQPPWMSDRYYARLQGRYPNHPTWRMWKGYEVSLIDYGIIICDEWRDRGYVDNMRDRILDFVDMLPPGCSSLRPPWITEQFCSNHRSVVLGKCKEKLDEFYKEFGYKQGIIVVGKEIQNAVDTWDWYLQFGWTEEPAKRIIVNGQMRWPYLWTEVV